MSKLSQSTKMVCLTILVLAVIQLISLSAAEKLENLEISYLSKLKFELRKFPKLDQCARYWKGIDDAVYEKQPVGIESDSRWVLDIADPKLLGRVIDELKGRKSAFANQSLVSYLAECIELIEQYQGQSKAASIYAKIALAYQRFVSAERQSKPSLIDRLQTANLR